MNDELKEAIARYREGAFMNYSAERGHFWELRESERGILELSAAMVAQAERKLLTSRYTFRISANFENVLRDLSDPKIKNKSWLQEPSAQVYRAMFKAGLAKSFEAYKDERLCGALLGVDLKPAFIAETMYFLPGEDGASKACLGFAVKTLWESGYEFIDTQVVHAPSHPAARIGEQPISLADFQSRMRQIAR